MNVISCFDGMSCGQIALKSIGITPAKYYASEIDKYAIKVTQENHPDTIQMGSITEWREWDIDWSDIDLLMGGSPCQGFSMAGKQAGTSALLNGEYVLVDSRSRYLSLKEAQAEFLSQSYLFWEYVLLLDHIKAHNPAVRFLLENVKMKKEFLSLITDAMGVDPVFINSGLVSAQHRQRYYWANFVVNEPSDTHVLLKHVVEKDINPLSPLYYTDKQLQKIAPSGTNQNKDIKIIAHRIGYRRNCQIFDMDGKTEALDTGQGGGRVLGVKDVTMKYRKLSPIEYERLQTVPDNYTNYVSNSQRYKMLGNGWTVDIIAHILSQMEIPLKVGITQLKLFKDAA